VKIKGLFAGTKGWKKLLLLIWFVCISFILIYAISVLSAYIIWGSCVFDTAFLTDAGNPDAVTVMKFMQAFNSLGMFLIPALLLGWITTGDTGSYFGTNTRPGAVKYLLVPVLALSMLPISNMLAELNQMVVFPGFLSDLETFLRNSEKATEEITHSFIYAPDLPILFLNIFIIAVIPAIAEEFFFRGALQKTMIEWTKSIHVAIFITAFIFSLIHFQFFTFIPRLFLGMVFGYLMYYSGNIWIPVLAHFINNSAAVIVYYLITKNILSPDSEHIGNSDTIIWLAAGILLSVFAFYIFCRKSVRAKDIKGRY